MLENMLEKVLVAAVGFVGAFLIYRLLQRPSYDLDYERHVHEVLTKDEYKVKGRFEQ